jgi:transposase
MSEIDPTKVEQVISAIRSGSDLETACAFAEVSAALMFRWLEFGRRESDRIAIGEKPDKAEAKFLDLWNALKKARAEAVVRNVAFIQKAAQDGSWQAAAWWLERTVPEQFGKQTAKPAVENQAQKPLEG